MTIPDRTGDLAAYAGQAPWDIGQPQQACFDAANPFAASILDAGCGSGENALFFGGRGRKVS